MISKTIVRKNEYYDSVTLMSLSSKLLGADGVEEAVVSMATKMNKELLSNIGMSTDEVEQSGDNDLIIAIKAASQEHYDGAIELANELLTSKGGKQKKGEEQAPKTLSSALKRMPDANMAVISVPGEYAAREAKLALEKGLNVMIFSDNMSIEHERELKEFAREKGLFVMGPDCGTAAINNAGLCFANKVRSGGIGLVGASGTGLQEVMVQIDRLGGGVSQAIGTGGRDLHQDIGGIMMIQGIKALAQDEATNVIVLVSKPPAKAVELEIMEVVKGLEKPVVVCFIEGEASEAEKAGAVFASSLEDAAVKAVELSGIGVDVDNDAARLEKAASDEKAKLKAEQKFLRGLFCGGTMCAEALHVLRGKLSNIKSNVAKKEEEKLSDIRCLEGNVLLDLGDDEFTVGKPHPMIDPALRLEKIAEQANDGSIGVILLDFELGYGSHEDPVGITIPAIRKAKEAAASEGRHIAFVGYICGTREDIQGYEKQKGMLEAEGVIIAGSNVQAAEVAAKILA